MRRNYTIEFVSGYKMVVSVLRIILGMTIFYFGCNLKKFLLFFSRKEFAEDPNDLLFNFVFNHTNAASINLTCILASALILFSLLEIIFAIGLLFRDKRGAVGLFALSLLWIPFEILFVSKFLLFPRIITLLIDIIILGILLRIILHFKKNKKLHKFKE